MISLNEIDGAKSPRTWDEALYSQSYLLRRQIMQISETHRLLLSRYVFLEKIFASTIHVLTDLVNRYPPLGWSGDSKKRIDKLRSDYGYVFQEYVGVLLTRIFAHAKMQFYFERNIGGRPKDAVVLLKRHVLVVEIFHHPLSLSERENAGAAMLAEHLKDNVEKAYDGCRVLAGNLSSEIPAAGMNFFLPIIVSSERLPITEQTALTFKSVLEQTASREMVNGNDKILPIQILSVVQLEFLDREFGPGQSSDMLRFLRERARDDMRRFCSAVGDLGKGKRYHRLQELFDKAHGGFLAEGPSLFSNSQSQKSD